MTSNQIIPKVEKRLASWLEIRAKNEELWKTETDRKTITISREFGCQGYPLAAALQKKLEAKTNEDWTIFDKALIDKISEDHQIASHLLENLGERAKYLDYVIASLMPGWKSEEDAYKLIIKTIFSIAKQGNAIMVGRGAFAVTQNLKNCYHYRLVAPKEFRVKTYAALLGISHEKAEQIVLEKEINRHNFLQDFYNTEFSGNEFNIVFNNSRMSVEQIAETIICSLGDVV
jgi:cytidylate kinase